MAELVKVVARMLDGKVLKGTTLDFNPAKPTFHVAPSNGPAAQPAVPVEIRALKAIFFVRDYVGDAAYCERKEFDADARPAGRPVRVTFADGEVLVGTTMAYDKKRPGFFLFPADPNSNNAKVFVVSSSVREVKVG